MGKVALDTTNPIFIASLPTTSKNNGVVTMQLERLLQEHPELQLTPDFKSHLVSELGQHFDSPTDAQVLEELYAQLPQGSIGESEIRAHAELLNLLNRSTSWGSSVPITERYKAFIETIGVEKFQQLPWEKRLEKARAQYERPWNTKYTETQDLESSKEGGTSSTESGPPEKNGSAVVDLTQQLDMDALVHLDPKQWRMKRNVPDVASASELLRHDSHDQSLLVVGPRGELMAAYEVKSFHRWGQPGAVLYNPAEGQLLTLTNPEDLNAVLGESTNPTLGFTHGQASYTVLVRRGELDEANPLKGLPTQAETQTARQWIASIDFSKLATAENFNHLQQEAQNMGTYANEMFSQSFYDYVTDTQPQNLGKILSPSMVATLLKHRRDANDTEAINLILRQQRNLESVDLSGADLSGLNLSHANLNGANLAGANLSHSNLTGAQLNNTTLDGTNLTNAHLEAASLRHARLVRTNLHGADLRWADMEGSLMSEVILGDANTEGANLKNVSGLTRRQVQELRNHADGLESVQDVPRTQPRTLMEASYHLPPFPRAEPIIGLSDALREHVFFGANPDLSMRKTTGSDFRMPTTMNNTAGNSRPPDEVGNPNANNLQRKAVPRNRTQDGSLKERLETNGALVTMAISDLRTHRDRIDQVVSHWLAQKDPKIQALLSPKGMEEMLSYGFARMVLNILSKHGSAKLIEEHKVRETLASLASSTQPNASLRQQARTLLEGLKPGLNNVQPTSTTDHLTEALSLLRRAANPAQLIQSWATTPNHPKLQVLLTSAGLKQLLSYGLAGTVLRTLVDSGHTRTLQGYQVPARLAALANDTRLDADLHAQAQRLMLNLPKNVGESTPKMRPVTSAISGQKPATQPSSGLETPLKQAMDFVETVRQAASQGIPLATEVITQGLRSLDALRQQLQKEAGKIGSQVIDGALGVIDNAKRALQQLQQDPTNLLVLSTVLVAAVAMVPVLIALGAPVGV